MNNISFVIPAYDSEKTLTESIDSIFDDNFFDGDEVIIVNDCSTDNTLTTARKLSQKYAPNIKIVENKENKGCPASRNVGIGVAKNDLIFNLDSDNILPPDSISKLKNFLFKEGADIVSFKDYYYFQKNTSKITHKWSCKDGIFTLADLFSGMINPAPGGNFLYKKSVWQKVGGYWEHGKGLHEAWGFSFKLLINGAKFFVAPNTFYFHRYSHDSLFIRENKKKGESIKITNKFIENSFNIFDNKSLKYIKDNPDWYNNLEKHPLKLIGYNNGTNGKIVFTSKVKQLIYIVRKLIQI